LLHDCVLIVSSLIMSTRRQHGKILAWNSCILRHVLLLITLLFAHFLSLKMSHTCTYCSTSKDIHPMLAVSQLTFFSVADVKCGVYEINKNSGVDATHGPRPVQNLFRDWTEVMLGWRGPRPGPGPVLTLIVSRDARGSTGTGTGTVRAGTVLLQSGLGTFFVPEPNHAKHFC